MKARQLFLEFAYPFYTRASALVDVVKAMPDPVLVYQMSKVGSSTVYKTLQDAGVESIHVHFIDREHWHSAAKMYDKNDTTIPAHFHKGRLLRHWINVTQRQVRVASLVRDPIARHVSAAFELGDLQGHPTEEESEALRALEDKLGSLCEFTYPYKWFDNEIKSMFGVDVFDHQFNREEGFGRINQENVDLLILTLERISELIPTVLDDFVGARLQVQRDRVRTDEVYTKVKKHLRLPESTVRRLYDHPWMRHFYTEQDIEQFVQRWSQT